MLNLHHMAYLHPGGEVLFEDINLIINKYEKVALVGNNGSGKSTLLKLMAGKLQPSAGSISVDSPPFYVPQLSAGYHGKTVAQALELDEKWNTLREILAGTVTEHNLSLLNEDWSLEERCREAFSTWGLQDIELDTPMEVLSGGQKAKVFLAGIPLHSPGMVLLDEPSNHLDNAGRELLYQFIRHARLTMVVVSHDRTLLNLLSPVYELSSQGIQAYGGNYDFYAEQKLLASEALLLDVKEKEKSLRKAKETEREAMERKQKLDAKGKKKQEKAGLPTIMMNTLRNNAEKSTARLRDNHAGKIADLAKTLKELRNELPDADQMKLNLDNSALHNGKVLLHARGINSRYGDRWLWKQPLDIHIRSGERIAVKGDNGSGKTTLLKLLLGQLEPGTGSLERAAVHTLYIDQDYSLLDAERSVYEQASRSNNSGLQEHEIKTRLSRFLFFSDDWDKPCKALSGGERMRLLLCSLAVGNKAPDMIVLDEPTNNLDLRNIDILTAAVNEYEGTLLVVSHDAHFLEQVHAGRSIEL